MANFMSVPLQRGVCGQWLIAKNHAAMTGPRGGRAPGCGGGAPGTGAGDAPYSGWYKYRPWFIAYPLGALPARIWRPVAPTVALYGASSLPAATLLAPPAGVAQGLRAA